MTSHSERSASLSSNPESPKDNKWPGEPPHCPSCHCGMPPEHAGMIEQFCNDLNAAHDEILMLQGADPEQFKQFDWPEWSGPANSIRWAERLLGKKLAKTDMWSEFPEKPREG